MFHVVKHINTLIFLGFQQKYNVHKEKKNNRKYYNGNYIHANKQKQQQQIWLYHHKKSTSNVGGFPLRHWFIDCFGIFPRDSISCHEYQLVWELRFELRQYLTLPQLRISFFIILCVCMCVLCLRNSTFSHWIKKMYFGGEDIKKGITEKWKVIFNVQKIFNLIS